MPRGFLSVAGNPSTWCRPVVSQPLGSDWPPSRRCIGSQTHRQIPRWTRFSCSVVSRYLPLMGGFYKWNTHYINTLCRHILPVLWKLNQKQENNQRWFTLTIRGLRQKKMELILLPVLATVVMWRGKKSVVRVAQCVTALIPVHRTSSLFRIRAPPLWSIWYLCQTPYPKL